MRPPDRDRWHVASLDQLRSEIERLGLDIPVDSDLSVLNEPLDIGEKLLPNRFCALPMEGTDAESDGSPGRLTFRRYRRYAQGGFGLIWVEATAVLDEARSRASQLWLHADNAGRFAELVATIRKAALDGRGSDPIVVLQLAHAGRCAEERGASREYPLVTDDYLDGLQNTYVAAARLAAEAGFDGVDVKSCHNDLVCELQVSRTRPGKYGGSFENRTRFLRDTLAGIKQNVPGLFPTTRIGVDTAGGTEHVRLATMLTEAGIPVLNVSAGDAWSDPTFGIPAAGGSPAGEHPLVGLARRIRVTREVQEAFPDLPVVGRGYSWLRQFMPHVAAGVVRSGGAAIAGIGRGALAYPDAVADILETGRMDPARCCTACSACMQVLLDGGTAGCVIRDSEIYGPEYRHQRRFALDHLKEEACRCHYCEAAPCSTGCPTRIDVAAFIKAFAEDDVPGAFEIIRRSNVLPEMCSHLCPTHLLCEGSCIESTLSGNPIPIADIQYAVCWLAREEGLTPVRLATAHSGRKIAIAGGGPAGVACAARLLEMGHSVTIIERDAQLGGMPESVIRSTRFSGAQAEIDAMLRPAIEAGRLEVRFGEELGRNIALAGLREQYDAVLLAAGLWKELSLGTAEGVVAALAFLKSAKGGQLTSVPSKVAVLSGGDSAMDAAETARELGAVDLYVVYGGSLSAMHWHMPDGWFRTSGAHCLSLTQPVGYEVDDAGRLTGLRICRTEYGPAGAWGERRATPVPATESVLEVGMVIEAMGLQVADELRTALEGVAFTDDGLVKTAGEDSFGTELEKVFVAGALINGGASVAQCVAEGMRAAEEIDGFLRRVSQPGGVA